MDMAPVGSGLEDIPTPYRRVYEYRTYLAR
jgi:hypothetical protein